MTEASCVYSVSGAIRVLRGHKVILDTDLARIYGIEVKRLNEQVKRNRSRFPADFAFQLTRKEAVNLKLREAPDMQPVDHHHDTNSRSQFATLKQGQNIKYLPYAFTEHGAIMAAAVLNSPRAVEMSVFVVRAFVRMREQLLTGTVMAQRLAEVERTLLSHDAALRDLYQKLRPLLLPPPDPERKPIGFALKERRARYRMRRPSGPAREES